MIRSLLPQLLLRMDLLFVLMRSGVLCLAGLGIYLVIARLLKIHELSEMYRLLMGKLDYGARLRV